MSDKYTVIRVTARNGNTAELDDRVKEVERYLYGRSFYLAYDIPEDGPFASLFFLVQEHYRQAIVDRLASGLFAAGVATEEERARWL